MDAYRRTSANYLWFVAGICLICSVYIDFGAMLLVWCFTAVGLHALGKSLGKQ